jgi:hypothetical protein
MNMNILLNISNQFILINSIFFTLLLIISIGLHIFIFNIINLGFLGKDFKEIFNYLIKKGLNKISIYYFILILLLMFFVNDNVIYLDENVIVTTTINDSTIKFSGEAVNIIFQNLGGAGVFIAGSRIAASLLTKHPMGILPKAGIIGSTGIGFNISYKLINRTFPDSIKQETFSTIQTGPIEIKLEKLELLNKIENGQIKQILEKYLGYKISDKSPRLDFIEKIEGNTREILGNKEQTSKVIEELNKINPN